MDIWCRGIRGATTVSHNTREAILEATRELLVQLIEANGIDAADVASAIFTTTPDLNAEFPALAARELGWHDTALLCGHEMHVPDSLPRCIRILIHWNTSRRANEIVHIYLRDAQSLRPELAQTSTPPAQ
jgi:chorismate mutase